MLHRGLEYSLKHIMTPDNPVHNDKEAPIFASSKPSVAPAKSTVLNEREPHLAFAQKSRVTWFVLCVGKESDTQVRGCVSDILVLVIKVDRFPTS